MPPRSFLPLAFACLALSSCSKDTATQALDTAGNETQSSYNKMRDYLDVGHKPKPPPPVQPQPRYCYRTYEDVICYAKPLPGEEYRLTGYQTKTGRTGYTLPPDTVQNEDMDIPLPPLKSVTVPTPPSVKGDDAQLKEIIFDPAELQPRELVPEKPQ